MIKDQKNRDWIFTIISFFILVTVGQISSSTWDYGDSITHYLYDHAAFQEPVFFLNDWAKPICVALSSPFAYFGFSGMKVFQALVNAATIFFTVRTCRKLQFAFPLLAGVFLLSMPKFILSTASGLTEPLFSLWLIASIYFMVNRQKGIATVLFSFLPFVRQEGLVVDSIVVGYLLFTGNWKYIFLLPVSFIFFGVAGFSYYHHFLWYFTDSHYNHPPGFYGYGDGLAFINMYLFYTGNAIAPFSLIGVLYVVILFIRKLISKKKFDFGNKKFFLISGILLGFITFHAVSCSYGLFGSDCMTRVLLCILPLAAVLSLEGFELITRTINNFSIKTGKIVSVIVIALIIIFPFSHLQTAFNFPKDFQADKDILLMNAAADWIKENKINGEIFYSAPYGGISFLKERTVDPLTRDLTIFLNPESLKTGSVYIWDSWFSVSERKASLEDLTKNNDFIVLKKFYLPSNNSPDLVVLRKN